MISSISLLQDKSSETVESNFQRKYRGEYSKISLQHLIHHPSAQVVAHHLTTIKPLLKKIQYIFLGDHYTQKMMTSNETHLTVAIADYIISEGISFNLVQKHRFNKVIGLVRNLSNIYQLPKKRSISKDLLDFIYDQNMKSTLSLINIESNIFGLIFLGDGSTVSRILLLNILVSGEIFQ